MQNTITELHNKILSGEITITTLVKEYVERARADSHNIYREVFSDIDEQVMRAETMFTEGRATALTGIPVAIKDNIMFAGHIAGSSSKMLEHHTASYTSAAVQQLIDAGAVIIGRTNMDECAMGSSTENSAYGPTLNPLDETRVPGGSSGGSAAALAADVAVVSLGSDTGGSIRQPATFCGVVGLSPTYGSVSRHGLISMGSSLDVIGPFAKTIEDAEILYNTIIGKDIYDSTSVARIEVPMQLKKKLAIPKGLFAHGGCDDSVQKNFESIVEKFKTQGYQIDEVDLPHFGDSLAVYYILMPAEVSSNLARLDGIRYGDRVGSGNAIDVYGDTRGALFGPEVRRRILLGTYVLSHGYYDAYYNKAIALREVIRSELETVLKDYDAIITPTTPTTAFKFGEKSGDPLAMYLSDLFTVPANIAQLPALSVPSGVDENTMPFGFQCMGARFSEKTLFAIGKIVENIR